MASSLGTLGVHQEHSKSPLTTYLSFGPIAAAGVVGFHLARRLAADGARVAALVRPTADRGRLVAAGVRCVGGSLDEPESLLMLARGCEVFFHVAGAVDFGGDWERLRRINVE